jgi:O-antigen/teichoic acid export membrane protein
MAIGGFFMLALMPYLVVSDMARVKQLIQRAFDAMISLAVPILIGSLLLSSQLIVLVSSADYLPATLPFVILMVGGATSFINAIYGNALVALNHQKRLIRLTIVVVSINIIMNLLLIPHIGIVGAAIANSTSEVLSMLYCYYLFTKITKIKTSFIQLPKVVVASIAMVFVFFLIDYFCPHAKGNPMGLIAIIIVLSTVYFGALATVRGFQKDLLKNIMGKS